MIPELDAYLKNCIEDKIMPGCVCWAGNLESTFFFEAFGSRQVVPQRSPMTKNTVFDLASLTKPVATALSIMMLCEKKMLDIDQRIADILPELRFTRSADVTVKQLLTHTSGLPAWFPTYLLPDERRLEAICDLNTGLRQTVYSCLGYIVLQHAIDRISGLSIDRFFSDNVTSRLGLGTLAFGPLNDHGAAAPTEMGNAHERKMARKHGDAKGVRWRDQLIQGEVHDGNAHYTYHGTAGNAGLFSNATDLAEFARALLAGKILKRETFELMVADHTGGEEKHALGWRVDPYPGILSARSFGHTGFTGTMLCVDPEVNLIIILLANAIHPEVRLNVMQPVRREVVRLISQKVRR